MAKKAFYITTTAPYVNSDPHIGFALEIIQADVVARYKRLLGYDVAFGYGTDEHGLKIYRKAQEAGKDPQAYCDEYAEKFIALKKILNLSTTHFKRTTDADHIAAAQEMWKRCFNNGDIYKKNYRIKYCVGCELEKTDSELVNGRCSIHPNLEIEIYEEENYFFRFSKYQKKLLNYYEATPEFVLPKYRFNEIKEFVKSGLEDFSVSRLKKKMPWGIDVPGDTEHVMYVWFDALVFYISTLGWPGKNSEYDKFWPGVQVAGKDNLRQQTAIWQAMLMSAGLPNSRQIFIHGFITSDGQKMSKSLGNVVDPLDLVEKYGTEAVRYYLLREIPPFADGDYSERRFKEIYNADLANGLGNLIARVLQLCDQNNVEYEEKEKTEYSSNKHLEKYEFNTAITEVWKNLKNLDTKLNNDKPWSQKNPEKLLKEYLAEIREIAVYLSPYLPVTSEKILSATSGKIKKIAPLFPRLT